LVYHLTLQYCVIIIVLHNFSALQHGLDGFPDMPLLHISGLCTTGDVEYTGVEADVLWPDALPDANPTLCVKCTYAVIVFPSNGEQRAERGRRAAGQNLYINKLFFVRRKATYFFPFDGRQNRELGVRPGEGAIPPTNLHNSNFSTHFLCTVYTQPETTRGQGGMARCPPPLNTPLVVSALLCNVMIICSTVN